MARDHIVVGLDVGSSKVRTVIALRQKEDGHAPNVIGVGVSESHGLRRGSVVDIDETIAAITRSIEDAERMAGEHVDRAVVNIGGVTLKSLRGQGYISVARQNGEIDSHDVDRVLEAAQAVVLPPNYKILNVIPRSYTVDDQSDIKDPVGMMGIRMQVDAHLITALVPTVKNITKCVYEAGVDIVDLVPSSFAAAEAVLSKRQRELGVGVIDIGEGSTSIAVFEEGNVFHSAVMPVGAGHVTNDIAIGLRTSIEIAERLKIEYGTCLPTEVSASEKLDLSSISELDTQAVSKLQLSQIIEARLQEIFGMANEELRSISREGMLPAGIVLTGGGVKTPGIVDLAKESLNLPVQVGFPMELEGLVDRIDDPSFATAIGLLIWGMKHESDHRYTLAKVNVLTGIKDWFKSFLPHS